MCIRDRSGLAFTVFLFIVFTVSEKLNAKRHVDKKHALEEFNLDVQPEISSSQETLRARPGCILVAARDYNRMTHLKNVLEKTNLRRHDVVVMTVRGVSTAGAGEYELSENQLFSDYERELFTRVVNNSPRGISWPRMVMFSGTLYSWSCRRTRKTSTPMAFMKKLQTTPKA